MAMYSASLRTVVARACFRFPSYPMRKLTGFFSSVLSSFSHGISVDWSLNFPVTYDGGSHTLSVRTFMFNVCAKSLMRSFQNGGQFLGAHNPHDGSLGHGHST